MVRAWLNGGAVARALGGGKAGKGKRKVGWDSSDLKQEAVPVKQ